MDKQTQKTLRPDSPRPDAPRPDTPRPETPPQGQDINRNVDRTAPHRRVLPPNVEQELHRAAASLVAKVEGSGDKPGRQAQLEQLQRMQAADEERSRQEERRRRHFEEERLRRRFQAAEEERYLMEQAAHLEAFQLRRSWNEECVRENQLVGEEEEAFDERLGSAREWWRGEHS